MFERKLWGSGSTYLVALEVAKHSPGSIHLYTVLKTTSIFCHQNLISIYGNFLLILHGLPAQTQ